MCTLHINTVFSSRNNTRKGHCVKLKVCVARNFMEKARNCFFFFALDERILSQSMRFAGRLRCLINIMKLSFWHFRVLIQNSDAERGVRCNYIYTSINYMPRCVCGMEKKDVHSFCLLGAPITFLKIIAIL